MEPTAKFDEVTNSVKLTRDGETLSLNMDDIGAVIEAINAATGNVPKLTDPEGEHFPTGIEFRPDDGLLWIVFDLQDGSRGRFGLPAPGKTSDQIHSVSEDVKRCFQRLFSMN